MRWNNSSSVRPAPGFIEPCLPSAATQAPTGADWVYEIKHDGYRLMVRKHDDDRVRIYTRRGADWTKRFPLVAEAVRKLKVRSILLDGEGVIRRSMAWPTSICCTPRTTTGRSRSAPSTYLSTTVMMCGSGH